MYELKLRRRSTDRSNSFVTFNVGKKKEILERCVNDVEEQNELPIKFRHFFHETFSACLKTYEYTFHHPLKRLRFHDYCLLSLVSVTTHTIDLLFLISFPAKSSG